MIRGRTRIQSTIERPFVCLIVPFVGYKSPTSMPSVIRKTPLVCFSQPGFTLIELVVTLLIAAILVTISIPTMRTTIQNNRMATLTNDLIADISLARSEALKRARNVGVCMSASGTACDGANWHDGRMVFVDANDSMSFDVNEPILRVREAMPSNTLTSALAPSPLIFNSRGLPANAGAGATFALCDDRGPTQGRAIVMTPTGQTSRDTINPLGGC